MEQQNEPTQVAKEEEIDKRTLKYARQILKDDKWSRRKLKALRILHTIAFLFMLAQTIAISAAYVDAKVPQSVSFPKENGGPVGVVHIKKSYELPVQVLISLFLGLSALDHFLMALMSWIWLPSFSYMVYAVGCNPIRWLEYTFSASLMSVLIACISGIYDVHLLMEVGGLTGICMIFGFIVEVVPRKRSTAWKLPLFSFFCGFIALALSWLPIFCYFFSRITYLPGFAYAAFAGIFVAYGLFPINMFLYYFVQLYNYPLYEGIFILLSFTSKTFLAWDIWGGFVAE